MTYTNHLMERAAPTRTGLLELLTKEVLAQRLLAFHPTPLGRPNSLGFTRTGNLYTAEPELLVKPDTEQVYLMHPTHEEASGVVITRLNSPHQFSYSHTRGTLYDVDYDAEHHEVVLSPERIAASYSTIFRGNMQLTRREHKLPVRMVHGQTCTDPSDPLFKHIIENATPFRRMRTQLSKLVSLGYERPTLEYSVD